MSLLQKIYPIKHGIECISEWNYNGYDIEKRYTLDNQIVNTYIAIHHKHLHYELLDKLHEQKNNPDSQVFIRCQNTIQFHKKTKHGTVLGWGDIDDDIVVYICDQLSKYKIYTYCNNDHLLESGPLIYNFNIVENWSGENWSGRIRNNIVLNLDNSEAPRYLDE